jgi:hypothetical protein
VAHDWVASCQKVSTTCALAERPTGEEQWRLLGCDANEIHEGRAWTRAVLGGGFWEKRLSR